MVVVGGHQHGGAGSVDPVQQVHDLPAGFRVEVAGRLVGQQHQRPVDERPGDRDPLLLATGQFGGQPVGLTGQPHHLEHLGYHLLDDIGLLADDLQGEGDIFEHGLLLQQPEVLEHAADDLAQFGDMPAGQFVDVELRDLNLA